MKKKLFFPILFSLSLTVTPPIADAEGEAAIGTGTVQQEINTQIYEIDSLLAESKQLTTSGTPTGDGVSSNFDPKVSAARQEFINDVNNVHVNVENYFTSLDTEEYYNTPEFQELINKLDMLDLEANKQSNQQNYRDYRVTSVSDPDAATSTSSVSDPDAATSTSTKTWRYGDILFYGIGNLSAASETSFTGHTAVLSTTSYYVTEASKTRSNGAKVYHWNRTNLWQGASGIKQYKVTNIWGTPATTTERRNAVEFGLKQVGDPYALKTTIFSDDAWYCSKLTMRQWYSAGYDLRGARGLTWSGYLLVIPNDIQIDANTRLHKDWGTTTPGLS
ncbi:hypothetical protein FZW96_03440 [Bacillus sp. BGMRC 2118]|nr:hypothetical protein FZW96_03440 [Bacillus sp. BGMRC 2118]